MEVTIAQLFPNALRTPVCSNSTLHGKALRDSIFAQFALTYMQLINCVIMHTTLTNTQPDHRMVLECELHECPLVNSSIKNSNVGSKFTNSLRNKYNITPTPQFNRIPPEV